eukprot:Rhum_TRINITY_DN11198_c0_g1::Rhum_TRINITY_DN11198_c0_g1_i1::g.43195::m.43195
MSALPWRRNQAGAKPAIAADGHVFNATGRSAGRLYNEGAGHIEGDVITIGPKEYLTYMKTREGREHLAYNLYVAIRNARQAQQAQVQAAQEASNVDAPTTAEEAPKKWVPKHAREPKTQDANRPVTQVHEQFTHVFCPSDSETSKTHKADLERDIEAISGNGPAGEHAADTVLDLLSHLGEIVYAAEETKKRANGGVSSEDMKFYKTMLAQAIRADTRMLILNRAIHKSYFYGKDLKQFSPQYYCFRRGSAVLFAGSVKFAKQTEHAAENVFSHFALEMRYRNPQVPKSDVISPAPLFQPVSDTQGTALQHVYIFFRPSVVTEDGRHIEVKVRKNHFSMQGVKMKADLQIEGDMLVAPTRDTTVHVAMPSAPQGSSTSPGFAAKLHKFHSDYFREKVDTAPYNRYKENYAAALQDVYDKAMKNPERTLLCTSDGDDGVAHVRPVATFDSNPDDVTAALGRMKAILSVLDDPQSTPDDTFNLAA